MNSTEDKIKWFFKKQFENIKFAFLTLSLLLIGIGIVGIEALSKRTNLPKELLAVALIALLTQTFLSIIDLCDQENKKEPTKRNDWVYYNKEGHLEHYYPDGYYPNRDDIASKSETQFGSSCETSYTVKPKSTNPIQDAIEKDKENLDQILDEDTSEEILTLANNVSRINTHPTKNDSDTLDPDAPMVTTSTEDDALKASNLEETHQEVKQPHTKSTIGDALDIIKHHSDSMVVKQQGQQLTIKATLNQNNQDKNNQWGDF